MPKYRRKPVEVGRMTDKQLYERLSVILIEISDLHEKALTHDQIVWHADEGRSILVEIRRRDRERLF